MNLTKENLKVIKGTFNKLCVDPKPIRPCRVKFMGEFVTTSSDKTIWRKKGHAKSAIALHFSNNRSCFKEFLPHEKYTWGKDFVKDETVRELIQYLEQEKILEYVEVSAEQFV